MKRIPSNDRKASAAITPLRGVRVADFSQNLAGPSATQILADLGADVVKIEPPGGDPARRWGPPFIGGADAGERRATTGERQASGAGGTSGGTGARHGDGTLFHAVNRNKRGVVLDLKTEEGRKRAIALASGCDVVVQAFRPGVADRFGIGWEAVRAANPTVIYLSVLAYGTDGPLRNDPGYDPLMQARSGLMAVTGEQGGGAVRVGTSIVDLGTGMWAAIAILGALAERERTGRGCHVTASLLDTSLAWMSYHITGYLETGRESGPMGTSIAMIAPYQAFACSDGEVMIAAGNDAIFGRLCGALGLEGLVKDPDYADNASRVANSVALAGILARRTRDHSVTELLRLLADHKVPAAPIHSVAAAVADPQAEATGMVRRHLHPYLGDYVDLPMPVRWDGRRAELRRFPPSVGEHQLELFPEEASATGKPPIPEAE